MLTRNAVSETIGAVVVALVTRTSRGLPTEVSVGKAEGLPRPSVVNTDNILTMPRQRRVRLMGQIHAALAYYHDHREALDAHIASNWRMSIASQAFSNPRYCGRN